MKETNLTLDELAEAVVAALEQWGLLAGGADRRISARPDGRTLRYYTSLGLLDPPQIEKRQARYGPQHVLQATVIKALQNQGLSLAQIQQRLFGLTAPELQTLLEQVPKAQQAAFQTQAWFEIALEPGLSLKLSANWKLRDRKALTQTLETLLDQLEKNGSHSQQGENWP